MNAKNEKEVTDKELFKLMVVQERAGKALTELHGARMSLGNIDPLFAKTEPYKLLSRAIDSLDEFFKILRAEGKSKHGNNI